MNYNFTDRVRMVLATAREEAIRLQHAHVDPEHILLALARETEGMAAEVLASFSVDPGRVREEVGRRVPRGSATTGPGKLPYTSGGKKVLEFSMAEARELRHDYVGVEHLLLALLRRQNTIAAEVLNRLGVTLHAARAEVVRLLAGGEPRRAEPAPRLVVQIDDTSSQSIYEQIVAQVKEAVAMQRLQPGERLPTVRQLADQLDIAPGTVARAYGELERLGVVVTEGARGTRVAERPRSAMPEAERPETLAGLLRPVAVAAFHLGASAEDLRTALDVAMRGIYDEPSAGAA